MKSRLASLLFVLATGFALAGFIVSLYTHWYFANHYWLKTGLAMLLTVPGYALALSGGNAKLWRGFGWYWIGLYALSVFQHRSIDLRELSFVAGLDYEASMVWLPGIVLLAVAMLNIIRQKRAEAAARRETRRALAFRRRLREIHGQPVVATGEWIRERLRSGSIVLLLGFATMLALGGSVLADEADAEPDNGIDRHSEFKDEALRHWPSMPDISGVYPQAAHSQERTTYFIEIDNVVDGEIRIVVPDLVLFEVLRGFRGEREYRQARALLESLSVEPVGGHALAVEAAQHYRSLRASGITVRSSLDVLIASFCIDRGYALLHRDRDFEAFERLRGLRGWPH